MNATLRRSVPLLLVALVLGCAATDSQAPEQSRQKPASVPALSGTSACFYPREVQNFRVIDRSTVVVFAPNENNAFVLRVSPPSVELRGAEALAFQPERGRICGYAGERLLVSPGRSAERLAIIDVRQLAPDAVEALQSATKDGAGPAAPRPQPGPGAEVEGVEAGAEPKNVDGEGER